MLLFLPPIVQVLIGVVVIAIGLAVHMYIIAGLGLVAIAALLAVLLVWLTHGSGSGEPEASGHQTAATPTTTAGAKVVTTTTAPPPPPTTSPSGPDRRPERT